MRYSNEPFNKEFRQQLRRKSTPAERIVWKHLQNRQLEGLKFRQQHGYGPYVMDFYCPTIRLCIEIDGESHDSNEAKFNDENRTAFLEQNGITVIRFRNEEIEKDIDNVICKIKEFINNRDWVRRYTKTPNPLI